MKQIALMGLTLALAASSAMALYGLSSAASKFAPRHKQIWPRPGTTIPTNARFVIVGTNGDFGESKKPRLVSKNHTVPLSVNRSKGIVYLKPDSMLHPVTRYELVVDTQYYILESFGTRTLSWDTGAGQDTTPPKWRSIPTVSPRGRDLCGRVCFDFQVQVDEDYHDALALTAEIESVDWAMNLAEVLEDTGTYFGLKGMIEMMERRGKDPPLLVEDFAIADDADVTFCIECDRMEQNNQKLNISGKYAVSLYALDSAFNKSKAPWKALSVGTPQVKPCYHPWEQ